MNVLIIQGAKLGDMVCTTPMFRALKAKYPEAHLFVMGDELNKHTLAGNRYIKEYLVLPKTNRELRQLIRSKKIQYACVTSPNPAALWALVVVGVPCIVAPKIEGGFSPYATKTYRLLSYLFAVRVMHAMGHYAPREYLRLLEPLGVYSEDTRKDIYIAPEARESVAAMLERAGLEQGDFLVGIAPGVGNKIKVWGGARFAEVAEALQKKYNAKIILIGGSRDASEVETMLRSLKNRESVVDLSQKLSLEELKALIAHLKLFISVDTGPIYIAEALGVPTVDIVGPMDEREQPPRGEKHVVVVAPRKEPAVHIMNASMVDIAEARRQTDAITAHMVIAEASGLIEKLGLGA